MNRAQALNVSTAKLPIQEHIQLRCSAVLTIVHGIQSTLFDVIYFNLVLVVDLLCKHRQYESWSEAINHVIPERKRKE